MGSLALGLIRGRAGDARIGNQGRRGRDVEVGENELDIAQLDIGAVTVFVNQLHASDCLLIGIDLDGDFRHRSCAAIGRRKAELMIADLLDLKSANRRELA